MSYVSMSAPEQDPEDVFAETPAEREHRQRTHNEWLSWEERSHLLMKQLIESEQHHHIQSIWIECLGYQRWLDMGGWDRIGIFLTQGHLMVREAPSAVFAEIGYLILKHRSDPAGHNWDLSRFLKFVWRQTKMMACNPQLGHPDMFWRNKLIKMQEWSAGIEAKQNTVPPRPESFGSWS